MTLLRLCKQNHIHTVIETCGYFPTDLLEECVSLCDLFLWDVKDTDRDRHLRYTGRNHDLILHNLLAADEMGAKTRLRCLLVAPVNTSEIHYHNLCRIYHRLHHCEGIEFLPYHAYGDAKAEALGLTVTSEFSAPSSDELNNAKRILRENGVPVL
jgi:pyruvate formate lyase activating enzyme